MVGLYDDAIGVVNGFRWLIWEMHKLKKCADSAQC